FDSVLRGLPNVILTPHVGGSTEEAQQAIGRFVAKKLSDYVTTGSTMLSVNLPNLQLEPTGVGRIKLLHRNVPGVLATVNQIFADHGANIEGQMLATRGDIGYVVTDISDVTERGASAKLQALDTTIRLRIRDAFDRPEFPPGPAARGGPAPDAARTACGTDPTPDRARRSFSRGPVGVSAGWRPGSRRPRRPSRPGPR